MYTWLDENGIVRQTEEFPPPGRLIIILRKSTEEEKAIEAVMPREEE